MFVARLTHILQDPPPHVKHTSANKGPAHLKAFPAPYQLGQELSLTCMDVVQRARVDGDALSAVQETWLDHNNVYSDVCS
eukprot:5513092-Pyramimonas_sp.AAC.1